MLDNSNPLHQTFLLHPSGANVRSSTGWSCVTPCLVEIRRKSSFALEFEKQGYKLLRIMVRTEIDNKGRNGLAGNIILGGLIGAAIDSGSGAMYSHPVNQLIVELEKESKHEFESVKKPMATP